LDFLIHFLRNAFELNEFEAKKASSLFEKKCFKKGTLIQSEGQNQGNLLIVETGIIREFYSIDSKEITKWLSIPSSILVDLSSYFQQGKTRFSLQALQDTTLYQLSHLNYSKLKEFVPTWSTKETLLIAKCFITIEARLYQAHSALMQLILLKKQNEVLT